MIYVFGDSFSAWKKGWPGLIGSETTGFRGSSEYRIYKTYLEYKDKITTADTVIFCHTHYSRVYLKDTNKSLSSRLLESHPFCDLLFGDIASKNEDRFIDILEEIWDDDFFEYTYNKIMDDCKAIPNSIHITFFDSVANKHNIHNFSDLFKKFPGDRTHNHMTIEGNVHAGNRLNLLLG